MRARPWEQTRRLALDPAHAGGLEIDTIRLSPHPFGE
jgi:hypothetical protein